MQHRPRKRFGQNFLQDTSVIFAIIQAITPQTSDDLIEIGPGQGALTLPLLKAVEHLTAIEIDTDLYAYLKSLPETQGKLKLIQADALTINFSSLGKHLRLVGNLPYNISTPLIIHLLEHRAHIVDMHFMLQKEVIERLAATPGSKAYGRLSIIVQYFCEVEPLFIVPPSAFFPPPKVDSAIVRLTPYQTLPYPNCCIKTLQQIVAQAFSMRRKTLANNLKPILNAAELSALSIDPSRRPEQISIEEYVNIAQWALESGKIRQN